MLPLFLKGTGNVLASLSLVFWLLLRIGSFPDCWRQANVIPIIKSAPFPSVANYRPIYKISELSKVFKCLVSFRLRPFMERSAELPTSQFAYWQGLGICDAVLYLSHTPQSAFESRQVFRIMKIDFSAALGRVNYQGIDYID